MSKRIEHVLPAGILLLLIVVWWLLLVTAGVHGSVRGLFHPRVYSRALGAAVLLVPLASWHLVSAFTRSAGREGVSRKIVRDQTGKHASSQITVRMLLPLMIPLLLVPAAIREPAAGGSGLDFVPGGSPGGGPGGIAPREESALLLAVEQALESPDGKPLPEGVPGTAASAAQGPFSREPESLFTDPSGVEIAETGMIVISDEDYARAVDRIWDDPRRFSGRAVEMVSFVFRRPQWPEALFTAARLSIWCCLVDAAVIGLLVETDPRDAPRDDEWIRIRGTLGVLDSFDTGTVLMENVPILREASWEVVPKPDFEYVFPADW